jgi:hypothetical protein
MIKSQISKLSATSDAYRHADRGHFTPKQQIFCEPLFTGFGIRQMTLVY